jgi:glucose repression regulatory protein TUP1
MQGGLNKRWIAHEDHIYSVDISNDGKFIATASKDCTVKVWSSKSQQHDMHHGNEEPNEYQHFVLQSSVKDVVISPDCRFVAAGAFYSSVHVWDIASGSMIAELTAHRASVYSLAFSPSTSHIISGWSDRTVRLWELDPTVQRTTGSKRFGASSVQVLEGHAVCCISLVLDMFIDHDEGLDFISSNNSRCLMDSLGWKRQQRANLGCRYRCSPVHRCGPRRCW